MSGGQGGAWTAPDLLGGSSDRPPAYQGLGPRFFAFGQVSLIWVFGLSGEMSA
jgi:hypothetical protein